MAQLCRFCGYPGTVVRLACRCVDDHAFVHLLCAGQWFARNRPDGTCDRCGGLAWRTGVNVAAPVESPSGGPSALFSRLAAAFWANCVTAALVACLALGGVRDRRGFTFIIWVALLVLALQVVQVERAEWPVTRASACAGSFVLFVMAELAVMPPR